MLYVLNTAVDQYDPAYYGQGNDLKGCVKDALAIKPFLTYEDGCLYTELFNADCRKGEVLSNLGYFASEMKKGDTLIWFHSGHGSYQDTSIGRATCRCLHDDILWDYELLAAWKAFDPGVNIVTISDTCFSESNSRLVANPIEGYCKARNLILPRDMKPKATKGKVPTKIALLNLSACTVQQVSYENEGGGVFTQTLRTMLMKRMKAFKWSEAAKLLNKEIDPAYHQNPILEINTGAVAKALLKSNALSIL
jgi:hypothetical protein